MLKVQTGQVHEANFGRHYCIMLLYSLPHHFFLVLVDIGSCHLTYSQVETDVLHHLLWGCKDESNHKKLQLLVSKTVSLRMMYEPVTGYS